MYGKDYTQGRRSDLMVGFQQSLINRLLQLDDRYFAHIRLDIAVFFLRVVAHIVGGVSRSNFSLTFSLVLARHFRYLLAHCRLILEMQSLFLRL